MAAGRKTSGVQDDDSAEDPRGKHSSNQADCAGHVAGDQKNAGTDGVADNDGRRRPDTEATYQL